MNICEFYTAVGGDFEEVSGRLQNEALISRFVKKFAADPSHAELIKARAAGDIESTFRAAHTLKGVAASLGLSSLFSAASELTELLRPRKEIPEEKYFTALEKEYKKVIDAIEKLDA